MWLILGLSSGLLHALMSMVSKKVMRDAHPFLAAFAYAAFSLPFALLALMWMDFVQPAPIFWLAAGATSLLNIAALSLYMKALSIGELSLTVPFLAFSPVFLIFTSALMLGEMPSALGISGILLIVVGAYALEIKKGSGFIGPFRALKQNKGGLLVLMVALIYAFSSNLDKIAIEAASPITRIIVVQALMGVGFFLLMRFKSTNGLSQMRPKMGYLWLIGLLVALTLIAQMTAFTLTIVPYAISLKRTSAFFSVVLGFFAFKERNIKPKLVGSLLMIAGVILISAG